MRIASLLASATEIVCVLDLEDRLVAISHECDFPESILDRPRASRPRFDPTGLSSVEIDQAVRTAMGAHGSVYEVDEAVLRRVQPDLLLTQDVCEVCAVPTSIAERAAAVLDRAPDILPLDAHSLDDILRTVERVADVTGVADRGRDVVARLRGRMTEVARRVADRPRPSVLAVEWLDPVFVPGHWGPEMIEAAGGRCLFGSPRARSQERAWTDLEGSEPDVLLVLPCGYGLTEARAEADRNRERLCEVAERAIETGRAFVLDGSAFFNRSGPRVVDGIEILATIFHPPCFPAVDLAGRAALWSPNATRGSGA